MVLTLRLNPVAGLWNVKSDSGQESLQDMERRWVTPQRIESFRNIFTHCTTVLIVFNVVLIGVFA